MSRLIDPAAYAASSDSEHCQQTAVFMWAAIQAKGKWPELRWLHAIPNGGLRDKITAARMKAEGAREGVPDICLPLRNRAYCGLYLEMKRRSYRASDVKPAQREWHDWLSSQGYYSRIAGGYQNAIEVIEYYLQLGR